MKYNLVFKTKNRYNESYCVWCQHIFIQTKKQLCDSLTDRRVNTEKHPQNIASELHIDTLYFDTKTN